MVSIGYRSRSKFLFSDNFQGQRVIGQRAKVESVGEVSWVAGYEKNEESGEYEPETHAYFSLPKTMSFLIARIYPHLPLHTRTDIPRAFTTGDYRSGRE